MRLLHLSDTHLHAPGATTHHPDIDAAARLETVLSAAHAHGEVDAIALTGDICDDGSVVGAEAVRERLHAAYPGVPILAVPGNHDLDDSIRSVFGPLPERLGDWRVVGVATNELGRIEGLGGRTLDALDETRGVDEAILLLQHHPVRSRSTHEWFVLRDGEAVERRLAEQDTPLVLLTGHTHQAFQLKEGRVHHVGAPSTYYPIEHDGTDWRFAERGTGALVVELGSEAVDEVTLVLA